jgi:hypothetical protein
MPRKHARTRLEREGKVFWACATPIGSRQVMWERLGSVGLMEARRRRDEFVVRVRAEPATSTSARATTFADMAARWLEVQQQRVAAGELRPRTLEIYEQGFACTCFPSSGGDLSARSRPTTSWRGTVGAVPAASARTPSTPGGPHCGSCLRPASATASSGRTLPSGCWRTSDRRRVRDVSAPHGRRDAPTTGRRRRAVSDRHRHCTLLRPPAGRAPWADVGRRRLQGARDPRPAAARPPG